MRNTRSNATVNTDLHQDVRRMKENNPYRLPKRAGKRRQVTFGDSSPQLGSGEMADKKMNEMTDDELMEELKKKITKNILGR